MIVSFFVLVVAASLHTDTVIVVTLCCCLEDFASKLGDLLHTDEFLQADNVNKREHFVHAGFNDAGQQMHCLHEARRMHVNDEEAFDLLAGRNRADPSKPNEPHPKWKELVQSTVTSARPNGIKGSLKLLNRAMCPCLRPPGAFFCSCPTCTTFFETTQHCHRARGEWRKKAIMARLDKAKEDNCEAENLGKCADCKRRGGDCDEDSMHRKFLKSSHVCLQELLCEEAECPELSMKKVDKNGEETEEAMPFKHHLKNCCFSMCYENGKCQCGWNKRFEKMRLVSNVQCLLLQCCAVAMLSDLS